MLLPATKNPFSLLFLFLVAQIAVGLNVMFPMETFERLLALGKFEQYQKMVSLRTPAHSHPRTPSRNLLNEIHLVANYQALSNCPLRKPKAIAKMHVPTWQQIVYVETASDLTGYIIAADHQRKNIVLSFRGEMSTLQTEHNGIVLQVPYDLIEPDTPKETPHVHFGYYWAFRAVRTRMMNLLAATQKHYPSYRIVVTGYGYGAPIAVYAALDMSQVLDNPNRQLTLVTFGSPRPGDQMFAKMVNQYVRNHYRVTHHFDPYPQFPPPSFKYEHAGQEVYFSQAVMKKPLLCAKGLGEDPRCILGHGKWTNKKDHNDYWKSLKCAKGEQWGDAVKMTDAEKKQEQDAAQKANAATRKMLVDMFGEEKFFDVFQKIPIQ